MRIVGALLVSSLVVGACGKKTEDGGTAKTGEGSAKPPPPPPAAASEKWSASLVVGANITEFVVAFTKSGETWTAALEGLTPQPLPLADVALAPDKIKFTLQKKGPESTWERYELARTGDAAKGNGVIGAVTLPIRMVKLAAGEAPHSAFPRPQTPKPPFPYDAREVTVDVEGGQLAGTLTFPKGAAAPVPAVLLWSGSGQQDRDETIFAHKPYLIVADKLTRAGFAVLRLDDRGTGATKGALGTIHTEIADAGAAIEFLKAQKEVDPKKIGMVAHSTGGMVAPNVALAHPVAFVVSLAGVAIPGRDLVLLQQQIAAKHAGVELPAEQIAMQKSIGEAALKGPDEVKKVMMKLVGEQMEKVMGKKPNDAEILEAAAKPIADATQPWTISYFTIDPREAWKKLSIPVLLVVGDLDSQVPADVTIEALTGAHAKKDVVTTKKLPGLNHLFQHAKTGMQEEYLDIEESFDPTTLDTIATWLSTITR